MDDKKKRKVKTHTFNGTRYNIYIEPIKGIANLDNSQGSIHVITQCLSQRQTLVVTIHESLHVSDWNMSEEKVDRISTEIGSLLYRLGYRIRED